MKRKFIINLLCTGAAVLFLNGCKATGEDYYQDGLSYYRDSDYSKAVECFQKAVENDGDNISYSVYLGMSQLETGDYAGALDTFTVVTKADDDNRDAYRGLGIAYMNKGSYEDAAKSFNKVIELSDKYDNIRMDAMKYLAGCYYEQKNYSDAVSLYSEVISQSGKKAGYELYYLRGTAYIMLGDESNAALDYEKSLELEGNDYNLCCNMYYNFKNGGYTDRAESYLKRIILAEDADSYLKGKTYFILGNYEEAERYLTAAYDDGNNEAAYYLAMTYEKKKDYLNADKLYQTYLSRHSDDYGIYNQYGAYLINMGDYENALVYIETGLELAKDDEKEELLFNQAVCYEYLGDYSKAYELFSDYVALYPTDAAALKELDFLSSR